MFRNSLYLLHFWGSLFSLVIKWTQGKRSWKAKDHIMLIRGPRAVCLFSTSPLYRQFCWFLKITSIIVRAVLKRWDSVPNPLPAFPTQIVSKRSKHLVQEGISLINPTRSRGLVDLGPYLLLDLPPPSRRSGDFRNLALLIAIGSFQ